MTAPLPHDHGGLRSRAKLAKKWAYLLSGRAFIPLSTPDLERHLLGLVERLWAGVESAALAQKTGHEVGVALVDLNCTMPEGLQCTMEVVSKGLLDLAPGGKSDVVRDRVVEVMAALAAGFVQRVRTATLEQQEQLGRSLYRAMRQAQLALQDSTTRNDLVEGYTSTGIATTDLTAGLVQVNSAFARIVDGTPAELVGMSLYDLVHEDERDGLRMDFARLSAGGTTAITQPHRLLRADGELAWVTLTLSPLARHEGGDQVVVLAEDATDVNLLQGQLNHQSLHDVLTRLPNRQFFTSRLEQALRTADPGHGITVLHLDIDGFSVVTGGLGRQVGDYLLKVVGERLKEVVADEEAMVARFGFDEFAILLRNKPSTPDVVTMVRQVNDRLAQPFDVNGHRIACSATIGVVHRPPRDASPHDLLDSADLTLRRAKGNGPRQWELADPARDRHDRRMFSLAATMPGAWEKGELVVCYQPLVRLSDEQVVGAEAVLRWDHPVLGTVAHEQCLALAEDTGLVVPLGTWLLRVACEQGAAWRRELDHDVPVRVPLTARQAADPELVGSVREALSDTGLPAGSLWLAAPADVVLADGEAADDLRILAEAGVGVEVDGFTAAPADLVRVADFPARAVRVRGRLTDQPAPLVERALAGLLDVVRGAGVAVSVAGVETPDQARWWRETGAETASGPLYAPAGPPDAVIA